VTRTTTTGAGGPDSGGLGEATLELHWAVQYLAAAGQTFVEPREDDSHRAMTWDARLRAFVGEPFAGAYPFRVALRPEDLTLLLIDRTGAELAALPLAGRPRDEGFEWLSIGMATYLGGAPPILARPEYDMPEHPVSTDAPFSSGLDGPFNELAALYGDAATTLAKVVEEHDASPVRCWPHHFDIATRVTIVEPADDGSTAEASVGVGFAPFGGGYDEWYWYVSPWPYPDPDSLPPLDSLGSWHTEGWTGAVLTASVLSALAPEERRRAVHDFLRDAIAKAAVALSA